MTEKLSGIQYGKQIRGDTSWDDLLRAFSDGLPGALERLYDLVSRQLYALALWRTGSRDDACDVVQDVFVRLAQNRNRLAKVRDARAWLLTVTHRAAIDVTRKRKRSAEIPLGESGFLVASEEDTARKVDAGKVSALLAKLPAAQREAIYLREYAGCTLAQAGKVLGVPTFTVASRYRLGVEKLRRLMEGKR